MDFSDKWSGFYYGDLGERKMNIYAVANEYIVCSELERSDRVERKDLCSPTADSKPIYARED